MDDKYACTWKHIFGQNCKQICVQCMCNMCKAWTNLCSWTNSTGQRNLSQHARINCTIAEGERRIKKIMLVMMRIMVVCYKKVKEFPKCWVGRLRLNLQDAMGRQPRYVLPPRGLLMCLFRLLLPWWISHCKSYILKIRSPKKLRTGSLRLNLWDAMARQPRNVLLHHRVQDLSETAPVVLVYYIWPVLRLSS